MPAKSARSRKWIAGVLHVARAAALLTIATGVNGTLAAIWPHYEPIYAYLAAVVIVAFLSSAILGATAAVAAVVLYDWMFAPVRVVPSMSIAVPVGAALLVVFATRAAVPLIRRLALPAPPSEPHLLPVVDPVIDTSTPRRVDIVDDGRVAALTQQLATARSKYEDESRLRASVESASRQREAELEKELEATRARLEDQGNRSLANRREYDEMRERLAQAETRTIALQQGLEAAQRRADDERARAAREVTLREQLEVAGHESLQKAISDLSAKYESASLESKQRLEIATKRYDGVQKELKEARASADREAMARVQAANTDAEKLQKSLADLTAKHEALTADTRKRSEAAVAKINALQRELDRTLASLSEEHNRADREARLRTQLEAAARETLHRTADVSASHQREASEARQAADAAEERALNAEQQARMAEQRAKTAQEQVVAGEQRVRAAEERLAALEQEVQQARAAEQRAAAAQEQVTAADERARVSEQHALALEQQFQEMRFELSELQTSHEEKQLAASAAEERVAALIGEIDQLRNTGEEQLRAARTELATLQNEHDRTRRDLEQLHLREELDAAAHAKLDADLAAARQETESFRSQAAAERARRDAATREFDQKLKNIVDGINSDYESAVGEALIEKETVKAELRASSKKLQELESIKGALAAALKELEIVKTAALAERDEMNRSFDEKLQRIVTGVTHDYEHSIGDALMEKEAAKAELRAVNKKLEDLRQKLDEEKRERERVDAEWNEKLQKIVTHLAEDHEADIGEAMLQKEAARAEARTMSARVTALQQRLEEEREKFRQTGERWQNERGASRRPVAPAVEQVVPSSRRIPVVLVVHSDANVRALSKHALEEAGYSVITAADGLEGLRTATQAKPDVVMAETVMPKMNARELIQLLKSRSETAGVKVILLGASTHPDRGSEFRADEVVTNPSDLNDLRAALTTVLASQGS